MATRHEMVIRNNWIVIGEGTFDQHIAAWVFGKEINRRPYLSVRRINDHVFGHANDLKYIAIVFNVRTKRIFHAHKPDGAFVDDHRGRVGQKFP